ncbi:MAG: PAS domain-containing protein, partial [Clostridia bacterium]
MGDSLIELEILRQRISELEGTITESLEEFYHTIKYIHGLLFKVRKRQDGHSVFTMFEGMIVRDLLRSQENVIGKTMHELFPLATAAEIEKQLEQAYDGKSVQFKLMYGTSLYCITLTPVFKNGYAAEIIGSAIDMTDLHRMETERLHMIEDFKQTLQLLPNAVFKCRSRDDGKFTLTLNEGSLAVESGLTTEQVLGKSIEELFDEANATAIIKAYTRAFAGETVEFLTENDNRYFHNFVKPVYEQDSDGSTRVKELVGFHSEITEKKMIEDKFQEVVRAIAAETGDALFHTLVNQLTHVLDVDGVILGRMLPHEQGAMQTIATYTKGGTCDNFTTNIQYLLNKQRLQAGWMTEGNDLPHYLFAGTPLSKLQLGWYMAFPLLQGNQELSGVLIVINSKPADEIKMKVIRSMGMLFSLRASAELERTLAEEELVKSNTLLKATQESLLDGILIVNEERQVIGKNRRLLELWEIPSELSDETDECKFLDYIFSKIENGYALFRKILHLSFDSPTVAREEVILT